MSFKMKRPTFSGEGKIIKKQLAKNVVAEANRDGTIFLDKDIDINSPKAKKAIEHEKIHMDQMSRGDLDYDDKNVYWKGETFPRGKMKEGDKKLPWEQEAWEANKKFKQEHKSIHNG